MKEKTKAWKLEVLNAKEAVDSLESMHHADNTEALRRLKVLLQVFMDHTRFHIASQSTKFLDCVVGGE
jgi:hypothetical protein